MEEAIGRYMDTVDDDPELTFRNIGRRLLSMEHGEESKPKYRRASPSSPTPGAPPRRSLTTWDENSIQVGAKSAEKRETPSHKQPPPLRDVVERGCTPPGDLEVALNWLFPYFLYYPPVIHFTSCRSN